MADGDCYSFIGDCAPGALYRGALLALAAVFSLSLMNMPKAEADDMASFATGGYARGLRSQEMKSKIDTNGDGMISRAEWAAYQEQVFKRLDAHKKGSILEQEFIDSSPMLETFATGGYERGLRTREMVNKIDTNHDHKISHDEFIAYQMKVFDLMDTSADHKGFLMDENFIQQIESNK